MNECFEKLASSLIVAAADCTFEGTKHSCVAFKPADGNGYVFHLVEAPVDASIEERDLSPYMTDLVQNGYDTVPCYMARCYSNMIFDSVDPVFDALQIQRTAWAYAQRRGMSVGPTVAAPRVFREMGVAQVATLPLDIIEQAITEYQQNPASEI